MIFICHFYYRSSILSSEEPPIQDALVGVIYADDSLISDVDSHRRFLSDAIDLTNLPPLLVEGVTLGEECIYVRVSLADNLEVYI